MRVTSLSLRKQQYRKDTDESVRGERLKSQISNFRSCSAGKANLKKDEGAASLRNDTSG
jgi:hypothetical protein